ncbi:hypothetical protein NPIL_304011 [Nephila pilipes]|uniref:Uncharacterized protein n=1 Tax=Nephila pilipes TaxID=299642 RepID=A0A8X6TCR3_NEPPI|nr:hypothetical protein NPIL_304011 [Nephila pilipes]
MDSDLVSSRSSQDEMEQQPKGELLPSFLHPLNLDAITAKLECVTFSSDIFNICLLIDKKINELARVQFSCPKDKDKMIQLILKIQEEARLKFQALKSQEISSEVSYFREITDAWGFNPSENHKEFQSVSKKFKKHQFKDSQNSKRQKIATSNRFDAFSDDESIDMQTSPQKVSDINCPSNSNSQQNGIPSSLPTTSNITKKVKMPPITIDNPINTTALIKELQFTGIKLTARLTGNSMAGYISKEDISKG